MSKRLMEDTGLANVDEKIRFFVSVEMLSKLEHMTVSAFRRK